MIIILCNICKSEHSRIILKGMDRVHKKDGRIFSVVRCNNCGLVFVNPQPEVEELKQYYPSDYAPYNENDVFKYGSILRMIKKIFINKENKVGNGEVAVQVGTPLNYLDFGCGGGFHLQQVRKKHPNWNLYGLDNNETACKRTRDSGFSVYCGDLSKLSLPKDFFDIVNMSHIIEHLNDPLSALEKVGDIIKKGGKVFISTPNFDAWAARIFRSHWNALEVPRHLFFFTPETLSKLLQKTGFKIKNIQFGVGPRVEILSLYQLLGKKDVRINPVIWRIFKPITQVLSRWGKTSVMTIEAVKE